ncbi:ABC transporter permease [Falsiroseomonas oryzae]|uniref:ABC transporter permease n=1 Tax=Falsiroseomonas oryzae TaxID=2766473 RepID=UPI0022EB8BB9|nr:ABC transporter permease [Roseomonas sp. MO-31]
MRRLTDALYPLTTLAVLLLAWEASVRLFDVPNYILPSLSQVGEALWRGYVEGEYWRHLGFTLTAMLWGYAIGSGVALVLGALVAEIRLVERFVFAFVVGLQSVPKVALAPLVIVWFGFGIESKVVLVALICFFPTFINVIAGFRSVDPAVVDMMHAFGASRRRILWEVKLPGAASSIIAGLQVGVVLGLIGAVVGEFIASTRGLGHLIQNAATNLDLGTVFGAIASLAAIGIIGTQLLRALQRRVVFWERGGRGGAASVVTEG